jgi:hypothetical protein
MAAARAGRSEGEAMSVGREVERALMPSRARREMMGLVLRA